METSRAPPLVVLRQIAAGAVEARHMDGGVFGVRPTNSNFDVVCDVLGIQRRKGAGALRAVARGLASTWRKSISGRLLMRIHTKCTTWLDPRAVAGGCLAAPQEPSPQIQAAQCYIQLSETGGVHAQARGMVRRLGLFGDDLPRKYPRETATRKCTTRHTTFTQPTPGTANTTRDSMLG